MYKLIIVGILGSLIAALSQIILKTGAQKKNKETPLIFFINAYTIIGYLLMIGVTLINLYIFKFLDLKYVLIFLPTTFILVILMSKFFLNEQIKKKNIIGFIIILFGIIIFNL